MDILPPVVDGHSVSALQKGEFRFLNTSHQIGFPPRWDGDGVPRLWQYNLHYFDWLWTLDFDAGRRVVLDWIGEYASSHGRVGWEPYPVSVRLVNWCGYFFGRHQGRTQDDAGFRRVLWRSLHAQCESLCRHPETHLLNNHYLENGAALAFVGSCFGGPDAQKWLSRGLQILREQIAEQILPDGVHFELSPMYHCRVLYVLGLLMETGVAEIVDLLGHPVRRMAEALYRLCHPDGGIALFNDSAQGICHEPGPLLRHVQRHVSCSSVGESAVGAFALPDAGYYGWRGSEGTYLIADFGGIGPDHNPGHGHADLFSFELSLTGSRVITDSGVHDYENSATRQYCRSTAAHNTVEIDRQNQCELWGAFRVARRGYPRDVAWHPGEQGFTLSGWHDGYRRLPGRPVHARHMEWDAADGLTVRDRITAGRAVRIVSRLHLHPACRITHAESRCVHVSYPGGSFRVQADTDIEVQQTPYYERFYDTQMRPCLCMSSQGPQIEQQYCIRIDDTS